jgi:hypothetical protein
MSFGRKRLPDEDERVKALGGRRTMKPQNAAPAALDLDA